MNTTQIKNRWFLRDSPLINSQGQVSISKKENVRDIIKNFTSEFPSINNPTTLKNLAERDVTHTIGVNNPIETTLPIPGNMLPDILAYLSANYHIALTYNNGSHDAYPLGPGQNQYYGRSYQVSFDRNLRYMENIEEYDLLTGNRISSWSCPERSRLMILRHEQISEQAHAHPKLKEWLDYYNVPREAVCVEDRSALSRVGKQSLENLLPDNLFAVGFVHIWEKEGNRLVLKKTDIPCLTTLIARWSCYYNQSSNPIRVEWNERDCKDNDSYLKCPAYLSFCTTR